MAKRINVKLIMELSAGGLTQNEIASSRHFSKTSVNLVLKTARGYYGAAEPPVRCGESHLSGLAEPPIDSYSA